MQAILHSGKQLQRLHAEEEFNNDVLDLKSVRSVLLRKLILTASSSSMISNAAKLLSVLNKEAAEKGDLSNLIVISDGQFPEVNKPYKDLHFSFVCSGAYFLINYPFYIYLSESSYILRLLLPENLFKWQRRDWSH